MCVCLCVNCLCVDCVIVCVCCVAVLFGVALLSMGHRHDYQNSLNYSLQGNNSFCRDCRLAVCHKNHKRGHWLSCSRSGAQRACGY